jgi:hypothetical protein
VTTLRTRATVCPRERVQDLLPAVYEVMADVVFHSHPGRVGTLDLHMLADQAMIETSAAGTMVTMTWMCVSRLSQ